VQDLNFEIMQQSHDLFVIAKLLDLVSLTDKQHLIFTTKLLQQKKVAHLQLTVLWLILTKLYNFCLCHVNSKL